MRAIWTGSLSFGLINIPVKLYSGQESDAGVHFKQLDKKTLSPIKYSRISEKTGKEVPYKDIVKGFEYQDGDYIVVTDDDFEKANRERQNTIDIKAFVESEEIDERYYEKPYYLEPQKGAESAYALLRESLKKAKKVAVAKFVLRNRDHLASIKPIGRSLSMIEMRFNEEVREPGGLNLPDAKATSDEQVKMALQLIAQLTKHFTPEDYHDEYTDELRTIIKQKAKGKPVKAKDKEKTPAATQDIMAQLKASLEKTGAK
jgi:DNA end-binding protein Ku